MKYPFRKDNCVLLGMSMFETLGQKSEVLLSIFCGTKINLEWITPPLPFLDQPPSHYALPTH